MSIRKRMGVLLVGTAIPLLIASVAYACASLATLTIDPHRGRPGRTISGNGANYCADPACSPVTVHFKSRSGPVLWEGLPNAERRIEFTFKVPKARAGWYSIVATQNKADGAPVAGTPGRASLRVVRPDSGAIAPVMFSGDKPPAATSPAPSGVELPVSTTALFALALAGLAATAALGTYWKKTGKLDSTFSA